VSGPWNAEQLFSSKSVEWATPEDLFYELNEEFGFDLDAAASPCNAKCAMFLDEELDALTVDWNDPVVVKECDDERVWTSLPTQKMRSIFLNPPWGRGIGEWIKKAYDESRSGVTVCCVLPSCTDTKWWAEAWAHADEIRFLTGRVHFKDPTGQVTTAAPKGSALLIFRPVRQEGAPVVSLVTPPRGD